MLQWFVQTSPPQPMEHHLCTVTPPSPELWTPRLPTPVPLATRWLDWWWGRVLPLDGALEMILSVLVRVMCAFVLSVLIVRPPTATCPALTLSNGAISYNPATSPSILEGVMATYTCNPGYTLTPMGVSMTRTCATMMWSGAAPTCNGEIIMPRCACASEVYGSVFVCVCVCVCRLLQGSISASKSFYRLLVDFNSWICKIMLRSSRVIARFASWNAIVAFSKQCDAKLVHVVLLLYLAVSSALER